MGNGKRETKRGKLKVGCFRYHEVNHTKSGQSKEEMKSGKLGMGGLREAVGAGLPTRNHQKYCISLQKGVSRVNGFTLLTPFLVGFSTFSAVRRPPAGDGALPGRRTEKRESQCYHEWNRRSQQRAQCAPAAATEGRGSSVGKQRGCSGSWKNLENKEC